MNEPPPPLTLEQFLSHAAHDLRQPLNVLQMYLGLLQSRANLSSEDPLCLTAQHAMLSMQSALTLLSQWARTETDSLKRMAEPTPLEQWITLIEGLQGVETQPLSAPIRSADSGETAACAHHFDRRLLGQTLQQLVRLLPDPVTLHYHQQSWPLELVCPTLFTADTPSSPHYADALYQLAFEAGHAISRKEGFELQLISAEESSGHALSRLRLTPRPL
ncbi:MAG: hypothetical protein HN842_01635 [Gammaproteobacteria bacterium]|jgi:hypothetical protein|nr:hypothetical protein [Gammaproteobacteria bacterium]MBT7306886.1 hypothetical protein [Gammaproteobacteria bacterium]